MDNYAVFDLETTGLSPAKHAILEIGWQVVIDGQPQSPRAILVHCDAVPEEITTITGITQGLVDEDSAPLDVALDRFLGDCGDLPFVGHNMVKFDRLFLDAALKQLGRKSSSPLRYRGDTAALYKAMRLHLVSPGPFADHLRWAQYVLGMYVPGQRFSLMHCCEDLGIPTGDAIAHRAAGDVVMTQRLYKRLMELENAQEL